MNGSGIVPFRCYNSTIGTLFYFHQIEEMKDVNFIFEGITEDDVLSLSLNMLVDDSLSWVDCEIRIYDEITSDESEIRKSFDEIFTDDIFRYFKRFAADIDITKAIKKVHFTKAVLSRKYPNSDKLTNINARFISQENNFLPVDNIPISIVKKNVDLFNDLIVTNGRKLVRYDDPKFSVDAKEMPINSELCRSVKTALDYHKNIKGNLADDIDSKYFGMNTTSAYKLEIQAGYIDLNKSAHSGKIVKEYTHLYPYENENEYTLYLAVNGYIKKIDEFLHDASSFVNLKGLTQVYGKSSASFAMYKNGIEQRWKDLPYFSIIEKRMYRNSPAWFLFTFENGKYKGVSRLPIFEGVSSDSIQESFKKISDLKKDTDKEISNEDFRKSIIADTVLSVINDEDFQKECSDSIDGFFKRMLKDYTQNMGVMTFKYNGIDENNILNLTPEVYYTEVQGNYSKSLKRVIIDSEVFLKMSANAIRKYVASYIKDMFFQTAEKYNPHIKNAIADIKINKIKLWANAPEAVNGICKDTVVFYLMGEKMQRPRAADIINDKDVNDIFDKLYKVFEFCIEHPVLEKYRLTVDEVHPSDNDYHINQIKHLCSLRASKNDKWLDSFTLVNKYIELPNTKEYKISAYVAYFNLHKYLKNLNLSEAAETSTIIDIGKMLSVISTASLDKLDEIKEKLVSEICKTDSEGNKEVENLTSDFEFFANFTNVSTVHTLTTYAYGNYRGVCII